jgi:hypothetical protein
LPSGTRCWPKPSGSGSVSSCDTTDRDDQLLLCARQAAAVLVCRLGGVDRSARPLSTVARASGWSCHQAAVGQAKRVHAAFRAGSPCRADGQRAAAMVEWSLLSAALMAAVLVATARRFSERTVVPVRSSDTSERRKFRSMETFESFVAVALESENFVVSSAVKFNVKLRPRKAAYEEFQSHG